MNLITIKEKTINYLKSHTVLSIILLSLLSTLIAALFYSTAVSFLYPEYSSDKLGIDSYFFILGGKEIANGVKPYSEIFDHKGLLAFLPSALGYLIAGYYGACTVNFIAYFIANISLMVLANHFVKGDLTKLFFASCLCTLLWSLALGGNANGLYVVPSIAFSYYFYLKGIEKGNNKYFLIGSLLGGLSISIAFNIRPSDGLSIMPLYFYILLRTFKKKTSVKDLFLNILAALIGFLPVMIAIYSYAYSQGFLKDMILAIFTGNGNYLFTPNYFRAGWPSILISLLFLGLSIYAYTKEKKTDAVYTNFVFITSSINCLFNIVIARSTHYWISYFPSILTCVMFYSSYKIELKTKKESVSFSLTDKKVSAVLLSLELILGVSITSFYYVAPYDFYFSNAYNKSVYKEIDENIAKKEFKNEDNVFAIETSAAVNLKYDIKNDIQFVANQVSQTEFNEDIDPTITGYLKEKKPTYIIIDTTLIVDEKKDLEFIKYIKDNYDYMIDNYPENNIKVMQRKK